MATISEIYDWFMTGKKPTQAQFWASWGSFWNKGESIPQSAISNLTTVLSAKTENAQFNAHKTATDAHQALFDLKQSLSEKGQAGGYVPLDEAIKIAATYLNIVNDLVTGGTTALLSAEQGKALQTQINGINTLLTSDNVNLDTVQEIVDAIENVQTWINTILVNDLTTGGTTKALTAEMGKSLKTLIDGNTTNITANATAITAETTARQTADDLKQDIANQVEVSASQDAQASWHGKTVFFMANVTITIPGSGLPSGYTFEGVTAPSCAVTWAITSPKVWALGTPPTTAEKSIFTLMQLMSNSNNIYLFGL